MHFFSQGSTLRRPSVAYCGGGADGPDRSADGDTAAALPLRWAGTVTRGCLVTTRGFPSLRAALFRHKRRHFITNGKAERVERSVRHHEAYLVSDL